jgi:hypothetical protein
MNPTIDQSFVDEALEEDPAKAKAEWLAEFRDDIGGWADFALIEQAVDLGVTVRPPLASRKFKYWSFVDMSGGVRDSATCAICHDENGIVILDCLVEIRAPFNPTSAVAQIAAVLKSYGLHETVGDKYAAQWVVDAFAKCGIRYRHSERDRSAIYLDALPLFTAGKVRLLDHKRLVSQFSSLERRTSSIGKDRVDHGPGGHDDLCNAAAGAMVLAAAPAYEAPMPQFGTWGATVPSNHLGQTGGAGTNASYFAQLSGGAQPPGNAAYSDAPSEFWRMVNDVNEQHQEK